MDTFLLIKLNGMNILENLLQMWLDSSWFFGLREDLQELIVGEEIESSKLIPLLL